MKAKELNLTEVTKTLGNWYVHTIDQQCYRVSNIISARREIEAETIERLNERARELGDDLSQEDIETARNVIDMDGNPVKFDFLK